MKILAIETSCDETAIAVLEANGIFDFLKFNKKTRSYFFVKSPKFKILSNIVASQAKIHAPWGGVVPNLAKREHQRNLAPILKQALKEIKLLKIKNSYSRIDLFSAKDNLGALGKILEREPELLEKLTFFLKKYQKPDVDLIAVTNGPGLEPALWVGINFAKALAFCWKKPLVGINHLEGHIFSAFLKQDEEIPKIKFPSLALVVSGGHTELVLMKDWFKYRIIGQTLDDAAGEAFDKVAKMLGLGYPGGPAVAACAAKFKVQSPKLKINLPRPMINSKDYNFSFSGLKTAVLYKLKEMETISYDRKELSPAMAKEFQQAVIDVLIAKTIRAAKEYNAKTIILGGGVAANSELRYQMQKAIEEINFENRTAPAFATRKRCGRGRGRAPERSEGRDKRFSKFDFRNELNLLMPEMEFTGDNAAMIALAAYFRALKTPRKSKLSAGQAKKIGKISKIFADSNLKLR